MSSGPCACNVIQPFSFVSNLKVHVRSSALAWTLDTNGDEVTATKRFTVLQVVVR
jgi:hypothetical protein